jgi:hypothetical protein
LFSESLNQAVHFIMLVSCVSIEWLHSPITLLSHCQVKYHFCTCYYLCNALKLWLPLNLKQRIKTLKTL